MCFSNDIIYKVSMSKVALMLLSTHPHKKQDYLICYNGALHCKSVKVSGTHMLHLSIQKSRKATKIDGYLKIWKSPFKKNAGGGYSILSDTEVKFDTCRTLDS